MISDQWGGNEESRRGFLRLFAVVSGCLRLIAAAVLLIILNHEWGDPDAESHVCAEKYGNMVLSVLGLQRRKALAIV